MISVCINTRNRPNQLRQTLYSILSNNFDNYEIVVVDQSNKPFSDTSLLNNPKLKYTRDNGKGAGRGKNIALSIAFGEIIAFTDDDCIVDKHWLIKISKFFKNNPNISGIFGKVLPYQPKKHKGFKCPSLVESEKPLLAKRLMYHWKIGFGNNMAFRKRVLIKVGKFRNWLGPGSIGYNADDAELTLRLLAFGEKIFYNPKLKVWHNRWLNNLEMKKQQLSYDCGAVACYGYIYFCGYVLGKKIIREKFAESLLQLKTIFKKIIRFEINSNLISQLIEELRSFFSKSKAITVALFFAKIDPISREKFKEYSR